MKILVCISVVPDTTTKINFSADGKNFVKDGVTFIVNPYDEWYALVRGIELKEQFAGSKVTLINVGTSENDSILRKGLFINSPLTLPISKPRIEVLIIKNRMPDANTGQLCLILARTLSFLKKYILNGAIARNVIAFSLDIKPKKKQKEDKMANCIFF